MDDVPRDAEPISEEQFERLPVYVHEFMAQSLKGDIVAPSKEELAEICAHYFLPRVEEVKDDTAAAASNSPSDKNDTH
jgi:hypothetical protein